MGVDAVDDQLGKNATSQIPAPRITPEPDAQVEESGSEPEPVVDDGQDGVANRDISIEEKPHKRRFFSERANYWSTIATAFTAVAALAISLYTAVQLNTRADLIVSMPRLIDVRSWGNGRLYITVQPSFFVDEKSDVSTVVSDLKLRILHRDTGEAYPLLWRDNVEYVVDDGSFRQRWASRPGPIVVKAEAPQSPNARFRRLEGNPIKHPGVWDLVLTVDRLEQSSIVVRFCINIDRRTLDRIASPPAQGWSSAVFRSLSNFTTTEQEVSLAECYTEDAAAD
jgi:hypothetical protein